MKYKIQNTKYKVQNTKYKNRIQNIKYEMQIQNTNAQVTVTQCWVITRAAPLTYIMCMQSLHCRRWWLYLYIIDSKY